jgi:hypothetical protein
MELGIIMLAADQLTGPVGWLFNLGVAGVWLIVLITGKQRSEKEVQSLEERLAIKDKIIEAKDAQIASLSAAAMEQAVPAIVRATQVMERLAPLLNGKP